MKVVLPFLGSGELQSKDFQRYAARKVATFDNTGCSRVNACAPDNRDPGSRADCALTAGVHGPSREPGNRIAPRRLRRQCRGHAVAGTHAGAFRLAELSHVVSKNRRAGDRVALRVLAERKRLWRHVFDRPRDGLHEETDRD